MKPALRFSQNSPPYIWQQFPQGEFIRSQIEAAMAPYLERVFGYHLLKIGDLSTQINTSASPIKHQVAVASHPYLGGVVADIDDLPFAQNSVDGCILTQSLEYHDDPHHILRETHRVLIAGGTIIITGFNPISFCGAARIWPFNYKRLPWSGRFFTPARVKDWLDLLGFEVLADERFIYNSLSSSPGISRFEWWGSACSKYLSSFGSVYLLVARKRVLPLTPIKPKWQRRPSFKPAIKGVEVSRRAQSNSRRR